MSTEPSQSSDPTDVAGRAGLTGALIVFAVGLLGGYLANRAGLVYGPVQENEFVNFAVQVLAWPGWMVAGEGRGLGGTMLTLVPLLVAAVGTYVVVRWRLPGRGQTRRLVFWTCWRAVVLGGAVGGLLYAVPILAPEAELGGLLERATLVAWVTACGAVWGALAGFLAGLGAVIATSPARQPEAPGA